MKERTGRIVLAALGAASMVVGLSLLLGLRALEPAGLSYIIGLSGLLCGALLLRIGLGVGRRSHPVK